MKNQLKSLVAATAGLLLLAATASANDISAWSQLGFTVELSSGTLNIAPVTTGTDASAAWTDPSVPFSGADAATTFNGSAFASAGPSTAISLALNAGSNFLVDTYAVTSVIAGATGNAAATAVALFDLTFANVVGPTVTVTITRTDYASELIDAGGSFGYVSAFLSLMSLGTGAESSFFSLLDSSSSAGWADFSSITLTVDAGDTVALGAVVSAGVSVPEAGSTVLLVAGALLGLAGVRRRLVRAQVAA